MDLLHYTLQMGMLRLTLSPLLDWQATRSDRGPLLSITCGSVIFSLATFRGRGSWSMGTTHTASPEVSSLVSPITSSPSCLPCEANLGARAGLSFFVGHSLGCLIIKAALIDLGSCSFHSPSQLPPPVICLILFGAPHRGLNIVALQSMVRGVHAFRRTCPGTRNAISDLTDAQPRLFWTSSQLHRSDGKNLSTLKLGTFGTSRFRRERPAHAASVLARHAFTAFGVWNRWHGCINRCLVISGP